MNKAKNLYYDGALSVGATVNPIKEVSRRLNRVLRYKKGDSLALFNGKDGLFEVEVMDDKCTELHVKSILKRQEETPHVYMIAAMVKKDAMDRIFRQATEFGATHIIPVSTDFTVVDKLNEERVQTLLIEASEQCERLTIPQINPITPLEQVVKEFGGQIFWCAEHVGGMWGEHESTNGDGVLIGPEGGFSPRERAWLKDCINITPVGLGNHILRADTAACAALSRFYDHYK